MIQLEFQKSPIRYLPQPTELKQVTSKLNKQQFGTVIIKAYDKSFIVCQVEDYRNLLKLSCRPLSFTSYKAF